MQSSHFATTALAVRLLDAYMPADRAQERADRIRAARVWLRATPARDGEDRAYRLLGLKWAGASPGEIARAAADIKAAQRPDGGWAQRGGRSVGRDGGDGAFARSDAYATGQALYALHLGGGLPTDSAVYRRGVDFLLRTRDDDGSWLVTKRAIPANNYLDAGFPHGESQYASYGATAWATMALMLAAGPDGAPATPTKVATAK